MASTHNDRAIPLRAPGDCISRHRRRVSIVAASLCIAFAFGSAGAQVPSPRVETDRLFQSGVLQAKDGHVDEAIALFRQALAIQPNDARLLDATGAAYSLKGDLETARQFFVQSLQIDRESVSVKQNLAIALFGLEQYEAASTQFNSLQAIPGKPHAVASLFLGLIAQRQANCTRALPLLEASGTLMYQYPDALLSFSECEFQIKNMRRAEEALADFDRLSQITPAQYLEAADLYTRLGSNEKALEDLAHGQSLDAQPAVVLKRAVLLRKMNRLEDAQKVLEEQASSHPTFELLSLLAGISTDRGDFAVALKSLKRAAEVQPDREESYLQFSTICADHGNDQLALDSAEIGLDHVPGSYKLTVQKGVVQEKLGHLNDAEETLRNAAAMQKDNGIALLSLAVVQAHGGKPDQAEQTLDDAIRQSPDNYYMYYFRAKLLLQFANAHADRADLRDSARRSLEKAIQLNPEYADSYYQLSGMYLTSAPKLAEQALRKCLQVDPNHIPAQYSLARLYVRTGRKTQGQALLARFKTQQRSDELQLQKQLRIEVAQN
jgi:tetratricopeptide (TPR) repeat protein